MNSVLERVNNICQSVQVLNPDPISFKKLVGSTKKEFRNNNLELNLKTKKDRSLEEDHFYIHAFYDAEDDFNQEISIEVNIFHNFNDTSKFQSLQITDFLIQIFDAVVHELRHQYQSRKRNYGVFSDHDTEPYNKYLSDPDELDAYALSIAIELLRAMPRERAIRYMSKISVLSKMRQNDTLISPNLRSYVSHFQNNKLLEKLAKKVYRHLKSLDIAHIFS